MKLFGATFPMIELLNRHCRGVLIAAAFVCIGAVLSRIADAAPPPQSAARCEALATRMDRQWPDASTRVISVAWVAAGPQVVLTPLGPGARIEAPAHCELIAAVQERIGEGGQHYAIRFHLRMPGHWNGRLFFQGGGGSNGVLGDALGVYSTFAKAALIQGFAVVSQDSGHDNNINYDPARGGALVFGFDELARANYGHASLPIVTKAAKAALKQFYGAPARYSYFVGCSKGGEEGMALAQRYAAEFDGIAADAPGLSLPRAAIAEAWDTQTLAAVIKTSTGAPPIAKLSLAFSDSDLALARDAVLAACDADDGLKDGVVNDFAHCTAERVRPQLDAKRCQSSKIETCLSGTQIDALSRVLQGPHDSRGQALYSDWPWDAGIAAPGWRLWKLGSPSGVPPSLNVIIGSASLSSVFTTPPTQVDANPQALFDYLLSFDFDQNAQEIYAKNPHFSRSAWEDMSARSNDVSAFRRRNGKMIVVQGVSDPVFSINDTLAWWREVDQRNDGQAAQFVRIFPVPGMNHCGGGDATDQFDVLTPLMQWVEHANAPARIVATSSTMSPHPNRSRPLCPYPSVARYEGNGDPESAQSFRCE